MNKSPSYDPSACCGADCWYLGNETNEPCWGEVNVSDELWTEDDSWWIHECQGHDGCYEGGSYKAEPLTQHIS